MNDNYDLKRLHGEKVASGHSILFRALWFLMAGAVLVTIIMLAIAWGYLNTDIHQRIHHAGDGFLSTLIRDTEESISKGQRNSFQRALDDFVKLDGVMEVSLFSRFNFMLYRSGLVSVGLPFVHDEAHGQPLKNPNEKLFHESNGRFRREDWNLRDLIDIPRVRKHLQEKKDAGLSCGSCHFVMPKGIHFDSSTHRATYEAPGYMDFYAALPVERECVVCHTHWIVGEDSGYLRLRINTTPFTKQRNETLFGMALVSIGVLLPMLLIVILVFRFLIFRPLTTLYVNFINLTHGAGS
ncbi:hypothetical protein CCP3SC5AM1_2090001 [Gammaproteobacteria bacterium]